MIPCDHAEAADTDLNVKFWKVPRALRVTRVLYINVTGLAEHATNAAIVALKKGATTVASWNTDSDLSGSDVSIPANTFIELNLTATDADRVFAAGDIMSLDIDESGTTTVPAGKVVVEGIYL